MVRFSALRFHTLSDEDFKLRMYDGSTIVIVSESAALGRLVYSDIHRSDIHRIDVIDQIPSRRGANNSLGPLICIDYYAMRLCVSDEKFGPGG